MENLVFHVNDLDNLNDEVYIMANADADEVVTAPEVNEDGITLDGDGNPVIADLDAKPANDEDGEDGQPLKIDPETQEKINKRIGKYAARAKTAEEELAAAKLKLAEAEKSGKQGADALSVGVDPSLVTADELVVLAREKALQEKRVFCRKFARNADGYVGTGVNGDVSYSQEQLQDALDATSDELLRLVPKAESIRERAAREKNELIEMGRKYKALLTMKKTVKKGEVAPNLDGAPAATLKKPVVSGGKEKPSSDIMKGDIDEDTAREWYKTHG
jgi:hypothetical protein